MNYPQIIKDIYAQQSPGLFGTTVVLSPPIADFVKDAGFDTVEKLTEWVTQSANPPMAATPKPNAGPAPQAKAKAKPKRGGFGWEATTSLSPAHPTTTTGWSEA